MKQKSVLMLAALSVVLSGCFSARAVAAESLRVMPLGNSITDGAAGSSDDTGYRRSLYLSLIGTGYNVDFVGSRAGGVPTDFDHDHEGHPGEVASWLNPRMNGPTAYWLATYQPEVILYHIGTNNLYGNDIAAYVQDANETIEIVYDYDPNSTIILAKIILTRDDPNRNTRTHNYNLLLESIAQDWENAGYSIIVVDMENALNHTTDMADNLHPNDVGYAKMADVWYDALDNFLGVAPVITSIPVTDATVGQLYTYDVNATGCPEPSYMLTEYPNDMTIDPNTGLIEWTPTAIGGFDITVEASNGKVPDANQGFTITVTTIIEFDANSSASNSDSGTTLSWDHTVGGGYNRLLVVGIIGKDQSTTDLGISSVTYGTAPMTLVAETSKTEGSSWYIKTELYYLLAPASGTDTVTVTYSGNVDSKCAGAISLFNVEQQAAEAVDTNSDMGANSISTDIITQTGGALVVDVVGCAASGLFFTTTSDMVERFDVNSSSSTGAGSTKLVALAEETTMSWSFSGSNSAMAHSAAAFAPVSCIISGCIREPNKAPIEGVLVSADNDGGFDITDSNSYYEALVSFGWSGTVTPTKAEYVFNPPERTYSNVIADQFEQDYENISIYDLDDSGFIGWGDVDVMHTYWLDNDPGVESDFNNDGIVDLLDFAELALVW